MLVIGAQSNTRPRKKISAQHFKVLRLMLQEVKFPRHQSGKMISNLALFAFLKDMDQAFEVVLIVNIEIGVLLLLLKIRSSSESAQEAVGQELIELSNVTHLVFLGTAQV